MVSDGICRKVQPVLKKKGNQNTGEEKKTEKNEKGKSKYWRGGRVHEFVEGKESSPKNTEGNSRGNSPPGELRQKDRTSSWRKHKKKRKTNRGPEKKRLRICGLDAGRRIQKD